MNLIIRPIKVCTTNITSLAKSQKSGKLVSGSRERPHSILHDPLAVLASKRSYGTDMANQPSQPSQLSNHGRWIIQLALPQPDIRNTEGTGTLLDIKYSLPALYPVRRRQCTRQVVRQQ